MLDTVALVLDSSMFAILNYDAFQPSVRGFFQRPYVTLGGRGVAHGYLNPSRAEQLSGKLYPRLKVTKRAISGSFQIVMRIEFSVPKLLYKNNFDEVSDQQFNEVIDTLKERLREKGVLLSRPMLVDAPLSKVDYSKNIVLEPFSSSRLIINELSKADLKLWLDLEEVKYRNAGYGVKFRNNGFELAFYDKTKDLLKGKRSDKKSEEKDNAIQLDLLERLNRRDAVQVLRIEARLNSRQKIRDTFKRVGIKAEPTFREAFNDDFSKKILHYYWEQVQQGYRGLEFFPNSPSKMFSELAKLNPDKRLSVLLKAVGIKVLTDEIGVRGYRNLVNDFSEASWSNSRKTIQSLVTPVASWSALQQISEGLADFKPVKLAEYETNLYSNSK